MGLERKNVEINLQKNQIEEKSKLITDSIDYAKNIQTAILPPDDKFKSCIPDSFILFEPKDIVSGDFYFLNEIGDTILFATVDCAGHGVPGAFMSIMANNMLENIVLEKKIKNPSLILDELNTAVKEANKTASIKYGMDASMVVFNKKKMELQFAGTNMPLVIVRNSGLLKLVADTIVLEKGDMVYVLTDGLTQNGMDNFTDLLKSIANKKPEEQKEILKNQMGEQKDDVLVVGIKI